MKIILNFKFVLFISVLFSNNLSNHFVILMSCNIRCNQQILSTIRLFWSNKDNGNKVYFFATTNKRRFLLIVVYHYTGLLNKSSRRSTFCPFKKEYLSKSKIINIIILVYFAFWKEYLSKMKIINIIIMYKYWRRAQDNTPEMVISL